jgi:5-methylcytosine-specific restriction endonuclease McrA
MDINRKEYEKKWRADNPDKVREYTRRYYAKNSGKPEFKERQYAANRVWRKANPEKRRELKDAWVKANPEKNAEYLHRRKARKAAVVSDLTDTQWQAILAFHSSAEGTRCAYCFGVCEKVSVDHVVPIVKGGGHTATNVVPACLPCNWSKRDKELTLWL